MLLPEAVSCCLTQRHPLSSIYYYYYNHYYYFYLQTSTLLTPAILYYCLTRLSPPSIALPDTCAVLHIHQTARSVATMAAGLKTIIALSFVRPPQPCHSCLPTS